MLMDLRSIETVPDHQERIALFTTFTMVLPVEFKPPTMYSTQPDTRTLIENLVRAHHQNNLLGKDGKIYDKAVVM